MNPVQCHEAERGAENHPVTPEEQEESGYLVKRQSLGPNIIIGNKITEHAVPLMRNRHVPILILFTHLTKV